MEKKYIKRHVFLSMPIKNPHFFICTDKAFLYFIQSLNIQKNRLWCKFRPGMSIEVPLQYVQIHVCFENSDNFQFEKKSQFSYFSRERTFLK